LDDAFDYACNLEGVVDLQARKFKFLLKPVPLPNPPKLTSNPLPTKNALIEQRRALSLCFKCEEKYYPGHHYKIKVKMLLGQEDNSVEPIQKELEITDQEIETTAEEAVVSMHATHPNPFMQSMRFKDQLGSNSIFALLDCGSTTVLWILQCCKVSKSPWRSLDHWQ
jgi:hypothetical protein